MTHSEEVELVVAYTGNPGWRERCDPSHPEYHPAASGTVSRMAAAFAATPGPPPGIPSPIKMAAGFAGAAAKHIASGMPEVSDAEYAARIKACETSGPDGSHCRNLVLPDWRCGGMEGCGCFLKPQGIRPGKARWATQDCPLGKWSTE